MTIKPPRLLIHHSSPQQSSHRARAADPALPSAASRLLSDLTRDGGARHGSHTAHGAHSIQTHLLWGWRGSPLCMFSPPLFWSPSSMGFTSLHEGRCGGSVGLASPAGVGRVVERSMEFRGSLPNDQARPCRVHQAIGGQPAAPMQGVLIPEAAPISSSHSPPSAPTPHRRGF